MICTFKKKRLTLQWNQGVNVYVIVIQYNSAIIWDS